MATRGDRARLREQQGARAALNRPQLKPPPDDQPPAPARPPVRQLADWPEITSTHPTRWQVHRMEQCGGALSAVLIAEVKTESEAFQIVAGQASMCRITKWGSKERPYYSLRPPRIC